MKKFISFSLFATLVILVLVAKNTATAQRMDAPGTQSVMIGPSSCPRVEHRWIRALPRYRIIPFRHYGMRWRGRPSRRVRYSQ